MLHNRAPLFERIAAPVGPLGSIASDMRQRRLGKLTREACCLAAPIPEGGAEAVNRRALDLHPVFRRATLTP